MVFKMAFCTPGLALITAITGVAALVVQEAFEVILSDFKNSSPTLGVAVGVTASFAGAVIITLLAPASKCGAALSRDSKTPVDSTTISISKSFHGSFKISFSCNTLISFPSTIRLLFFVSTDLSYGP